MPRDSFFWHLPAQCPHGSVSQLMTLILANPQSLLFKYFFCSCLSFSPSISVTLMCEVVPHNLHILLFVSLCSLCFPVSKDPIDISSSSDFFPSVLSSLHLAHQRPSSFPLWCFSSLEFIFVFFLAGQGLKFYVIQTLFSFLYIILIFQFLVNNFLKSTMYKNLKACWGLDSVQLNGKSFVLSSPSRVVQRDHLLPFSFPSLDVHFLPSSCLRL